MISLEMYELLTRALLFAWNNDEITYGEYLSAFGYLTDQLEEE